MGLSLATFLAGRYQNSMPMSADIPKASITISIDSVTFSLTKLPAVIAPALPRTEVINYINVW